MPFQLRPMIQRAWPVRQRVALRWDHYFRAGAGRDPGPDRHDGPGDDEAAFLLRMQDCLIPAVVPLTFRNKHDAPTGKCNKESQAGT